MFIRWDARRKMSKPRHPDTFWWAMMMPLATPDDLAAIGLGLEMRFSLGGGQGDSRMGGEERPDGDVVVERVAPLL